MSHDDSPLTGEERSGAVAWMARNGVASNLLMVIILLLGAIGLMQIMPSSATAIGDVRDLASHEEGKLGDPGYNVDFGAWYFARMLERFQTDDVSESISLAASAYNGGPPRLAKNLANKKSECVRVIVRVRPLSSKEKDQGREQIVNVDRTACSIQVRNPDADSREAPRSFTFD